MPRLYSGLFSMAEVDGHLSERAQLQAMLDVETALAEALAELGIIPAGAVEPIRRAASVDLYDRAAVVADAARSGNIAVPLINHLTARVASIDPIAARYVHWGATSQDILDTALVLQLGRAVPPILRELARAAEAAARQARVHAKTVMAGRTWLQQATPTTFGLKAAGWCDALDRVRAGVGAALEGVRVLQFGGASGTLAALGDQGVVVATALGGRLGLVVPASPWHAHRDRLVSLASALGIAIGTLGKIGRDLALLAQTEVGEVSEQPREGVGGSSTMPHKRNPLGAAIAIAAATRAPGLVATMLAAMPQEHERGLGLWQAEWETLPELVRLAGGAAHAIAEALDGVVVDARRMQLNLDITKGAVTAESVAMAVARHLGKREAHAVIEAASHRAAAQGRPLADVLFEDPTVTRHLSREEIARHLEPGQYTGSAEAFVDRILLARKEESDG
ncbi:MAG: 3-carboxy-cis,cis-muconate cycloisomerase [Gemmatimonadota bacterium]